MKRGFFVVMFVLSIGMNYANHIPTGSTIYKSGIVNLVIPTFNPVAPICYGALVDPLPVTSLNGIEGTWSPLMDNTATTTYTFTPNVGQNAVSVTLTIVVFPMANPQPFCDYSNSYLIVDWTTIPGAASYEYSYTINGGALQSGSTLVSNCPIFTALPDYNIVFTITNIVGISCFQPVTITCGTLANPNFETTQVSFSPNPVVNVVKISDTNPIMQIEVFNVLGQKVLTKYDTTNETELDMTNLSSGIYLIKVHTNTTSKSFKVIKS